jgi:hypothetical protein
MSRNNESPIEPRHEPESGQAFERLTEIERQLKKACPKPVELDGLALERLAKAPPLRRETERSGSQRRRYRTAVFLAGSWACGAMVGAAVVFLLMRPMTPNIDSHTTTHVQQEDPPVLAVAPIAAPPEAAPQSATLAGGERTELEAAILALSVPNSTSTYAPGSRSMSAGMHLPRFVSPMPVSAAAIEEFANPSEDESPRGRSTEARPDRAPSPAVTRGQLLQDLLGKSSEVVL